jgi:DNA repair protein RecN (Recombination protein N)
LDDFGGHDDHVVRTRTAYAAWREAADELDRLRTAQSSRRDRLDAISFQLQEIAAADPQPGEDDDLRRRRLVLRHGARIAELVGSLMGRLSDDEKSVVDQLAKSSREIAEMTECGLALEDAAARLVDARIQVEEVVREVQGLADGTDSDPDELEGVEARLHLLETLMLKYGSSLDAVLSHRDALEAERAELASVEERVADAAAAADRALDAYDGAARQLDGARRKAGTALAAAVAEILVRLAMGGTRLEFEWRPRVAAESPLVRDEQPVAFDADGVEECVLMIAANPGEETRPMARIASGGELSRIHLAIRTVLRKRRQEAGLTLLFDEVDSGLGGATAAALAELLAQLATVDQVVVVTHLPQVAARADGHFRVEKAVENGRATTRVVILEAIERENEVARMLAGDEVTDSARAHARVLLETR